METMTRHQSIGNHNQQWSPQSGSTARSCHTARNGHSDSQPTADSKKYALATGEAASHRLHVLHNVYGHGTRRLLRDAGLRRGMRVADLGCGVGMVTSVLSGIVGPEGEVFGVDFSGDQIAQARAQISQHARNVKFIQASATNTGLPHDSFDFVYSRFLLIHLPDPEAALREMFTILKPNGILVCEDGDLTSAGSEPKSALKAFSDLWAGLGPKRGVNYTVGRRLYQMVMAAGFASPEIVFNQPAVPFGENKRLLELSVAEAGPAFVEAGLITKEELDRTLIEMRLASEDPGILAIMPRMSQVWARKSAAHHVGKM
jgi:ubiquinone/menaquinone biosynthesis C-methylase UbiE